ncbi:hypothetical protein BASA61_005751 [Batrachochytrium salamandrivorans]|nr:hypothetical protein BASA61_005751 [Batrachochytrium salamandrivorans]
MSQSQEMAPIDPIHQLDPIQDKEQSEQSEQSRLDEPNEQDGQDRQDEQDEQDGQDEQDEQDERSAQLEQAPTPTASILTASGRPARAATLKKASPQKPLMSTPAPTKRRRATNGTSIATGTPPTTTSASLAATGSSHADSDSDTHPRLKTLKGRPSYNKLANSAEQGHDTDDQEGSVMDMALDNDGTLQDDATGDEGAVDPNGVGDADSRTTAARRLQPAARRRVAVEPLSNDTDEDEEAEVDPRGEVKITKDGYLTGGREFRLKTFTLPRHPTRLYMFSLEASKILGFRDTYIFFLRNPMVRRVNGDEPDRDFLRDRGLLPSQLRNRPITLVTARNLFRVFGHKIIRRGKPVRDDYFVGDQEEPVYFPEPHLDMDDDTDFAAEFVKGLASTEGGPFVRQQAPITILGFNHTEAPHDRFEPLAIPQELRADGWMLKCALSAAEFNQRLNKPNWVNVSDDEIAQKYPLAIASNQYRGTLSMYQQRFSEKDNLGNDEEPIPSFIQKRSEVEGQETAVAATPFPTTVGFNAYAAPEPQTRKRNSRSRTQSATETSTSVCCHCFNQISPIASDTIPQDLLLDCTQCSTKHHPRCIDFEDKVLVTKVMTYDWRCSNCKLCTICNNAGDDDKLLFCDTCDRGYHMYCVNPPLEVLPEGSWLCSECSVCKSCKAHPDKQEGTEDMWRHVIVSSTLTLADSIIKPPPATSALGTYLCTYCPSCYDHFQADRFCPLCMHVYSEDSDDLAMVCCDDCERWVHVGCDPELTEEVYQQLVEEEEPVFTCALCDDRKREMLLEIRQKVHDGVRLSTVEFKDHFLVAPPLVNN